MNKAHTVFSDGKVWPNAWVEVGMRDGLDVMSITEHPEWQPDRDDLPNPDRSRGDEIAHHAANLPAGRSEGDDRQVGLRAKRLVPLLDNPRRPSTQAAFSRHPRKGLMGDAVRTDRYRYTVWQSTDGARVNAERELHGQTINPAVTLSLARLPQNATLAAELGAQLKRGWRGAVPQITNQHALLPRPNP